MPEPKAKKVQARAVELGKTMGVRGVADQLAREGHEVGKSAVAEWLRVDRARRAGAATARKGAPAPPPAPAPPRPPATTARRSRPTKAAPRLPALPPARLEPEEERPPASSPELLALPPAPAELGGLEDDPLGAFAGVDPCALDFHELEALDRDVMTFLREAFTERDERRYVVLGRFKLEVRAAMNKLRPAAKVDPANDPASLEARAGVLARLKKMIANAKQGQPPAAP